MVDRSQKPLVAVKANVSELLGGSWVERTGIEPSAVALSDGTELARVNLMGLVVDKSEGTPPSIVVDDGTERIVVRAFESIQGLVDAQIGNVVNVIGRPRVYGSDRFLVAECARVLDDIRWLEVRKKELANRPAPSTNQSNSGLVEEDVVGTPHLAMLDHIRSLDSGTGADIEQVIAKTGCTQQDLEKLLVKGEIFEVSPGKLKVLE